MQGSGWLEFFQRLPAYQRDNLALFTSTGTEIILQTIVALEPEYVIVRGRTAGSQDAGRVLIIPYAKIDFVGFQRRVLEPDVQAMFGNSPTAAALPMDDGTRPALAVAAPLPEPTQAKSAHEEAAKKPAVQPSKSILLARLRARLSTDGKPTEK